MHCASYCVPCQPLLRACFDLHLLHQSLELVADSEVADEGAHALDERRALARAHHHHLAEPRHTLVGLLLEGEREFQRREL